MMTLALSSTPAWQRKEADHRLHKVKVTVGVSLSIAGTNGRTHLRRLRRAVLN